MRPCCAVCVWLGVWAFGGISTHFCESISSGCVNKKGRQKKRGKAVRERRERNLHMGLGNSLSKKGHLSLSVSWIHFYSLSKTSLTFLVRSLEREWASFNFQTAVQTFIDVSLWTQCTGSRQNETGHVHTSCGCPVSGWYWLCFVHSKTGFGKWSDLTSGSSRTCVSSQVFVSKAEITRLILETGPYS